MQNSNLVQSITQQFAVTYQYTTYFTERVFGLDNPLLARCVESNWLPAKCLFVLDSGVAQARQSLLEEIERYAEAYKQQIAYKGTLVIPGGEVAKNDTGLFKQVLEAIHLKGICRHSYLIGIGGGAVLDMVGFAAAIAHRGIRHIRIPTTVLSQNDSGVGVKNSFNLFGKKNFLGTFQPPTAVINDFCFLETLSQRDWIAGIAEAIKVALIKEKTFFEEIERNADQLVKRNQQAMQAIIYRCAELHMQHIAQGGDPFERGSARPLDFGHWAAHKLESMSHYRLRHGEAVAIGMAIDCLYAHYQGFLAKPTVQRIFNLIQRLSLPLRAPEVFFKDAQGTYQVLKGIEEFREHLGGQLTITLINDIGKSFNVHEICLKTMQDSIYNLEKMEFNDPAADFLQISENSWQ
ncbi:MAG: 3-dehydroquinate synthase [Cytophagales bacterium]|nr:3-dehydroquinate synthase [Bernardetiaceae bacterium]MDW8210730.1 3-dehydroquinate synthase [Cytophagales bacterium]